jgi:hypothetical protein
MLIKIGVYAGLALALTACAQEKPARYFLDEHGIIPGFEYISTASKSSWGGEISVYPLDANGVRQSSDTYVVGHDIDGDGQWDKLEFCGSEKLIAGTRTGCDVAAREVPDNIWVYNPCYAVYCKRGTESIAISSITIQPIIDHLNAAYNDKRHW